MHVERTSHETLIHELNDDERRAHYAQAYDEYRTGFIATLLGNLLIGSGTLVYGRRPSYAKFKAIEVIARIPYQSWEVATYTLLTAFYGNERRAIELAQRSEFSRVAQDNETMHVVVISHIADARRCCGFFRHTLIPLLFSFFYFWTVYLLYMISPKSALELNYLFESHAYAQYQEFLERNEQSLKHTPVTSEFLTFYGRNATTEYEFFESVRNDELVHRNRSIIEIKRLTQEAG